MPAFWGVVSGRLLSPGLSMGSPAYARGRPPFPPSTSRISSYVGTGFGLLISWCRHSMVKDGSKWGVIRVVFEYDVYECACGPGLCEIVCD